jgi:hypothetical protein
MDEQAWSGRVASRKTTVGDLKVTACLRQGKASASSPFLALGSDGREWWVKPPEPALDKALVTEVVVGTLGGMIGAPVCETSPMEISNDLLPWEYQPGRPLQSGMGSATVNLPGTITEIRPNLDRRNDDDNRRRHAGVYCLVDWFFGADLQWLQQVDDEWRLYSHDHGWYLPPAGPSWTKDSLRSNVDTPAGIADDPAGLEKSELDRLARSLEAIDANVITNVLNAIPAGWPVSNDELECLGWFLLRRAPQVATRLRRL